MHLSPFTLSPCSVKGSSWLDQRRLPKAKQKTKIGFFGRIRRFILLLIWRLFWRLSLLGLVAGGLFLAIMWNLTPDVRDISPQARGYDVRIWAGDGQTLIGTFGTTTSDPVTPDNIPQNLALPSSRLKIGGFTGTLGWILRVSTSHVYKFANRVGLHRAALP